MNTDITDIDRDGRRKDRHQDVIGGAGADREIVLHGPFRRLLRRFIHFFSYHLILARQSTRATRVAGFRLVVHPTVFHPRHFLTSKYFAQFIGGLDLNGKEVADVGTGSGILALAAARAGAAQVVAIDVNPNAASNAEENARLNGMSHRIVAWHTDLFSAVPGQWHFDVIISSPPSFVGEPRDIADRAWYGGLRYRNIQALFDQSRRRLKLGGKMYVMLSSDSDLDLLGILIGRAGFSARRVYKRSILIESFIIYELRPV